MTWVKLDDHFDEHHKFAEVGPLGIALWTVGLAYCNRNLTDGFIPWSVARRLLNWEYLGPPEERGRRVYKINVSCGMAGQDVDCDLVIALLLEAELWEEVDGGYRVHDYENYQPTREQVEEERRKKQAAGQAGGLAAARARATANGQAPATAGAQAKSKPVPGPGINSLSSAHAREDDEDDVDRLYAHYKQTIQPFAKLCPRNKIKARLKKFSEAELHQCIANFASNPWRMEHNAHEGCEWFFDSDRQVEKWLLLEHKPIEPVARNGTHASVSGPSPTAYSWEGTTEGIDPNDLLDRSL